MSHIVSNLFARRVYFCFIVDSKRFSDISFCVWLFVWHFFASGTKFFMGGQPVYRQMAEVNVAFHYFFDFSKGVDSSCYVLCTVKCFLTENGALKNT